MYPTEILERIGIARVENLILHEKTIPSLFKELRDEIIGSKNLFHPIIVEKSSKVVLDGIHRVEVFRDLGYEAIVAYFVDYDDPRIKVDRWYRVLKNLDTSIFKKVSQAELLELVDSQPSFGILKEGEAYISRKWSDVLQAYLRMREFEKGLRVSYETMEDAMEKVRQGYTCLFGPKIKKAEVIHHAKRKELFPPKSTRHVIRPRPMFINFPLELLRKNLKEAGKKLAEILRDANPRRLPPGELIQGRRYEEELVILR
jgi:hypothetical protein